MPSDKNDKTVFRQPTLNADRTVIRPAPGGRGAGRSQTADSGIENSPPAPATTRYQSQPHTQSPIPQQTDTAGGSIPVQGQTTRGLNPMVNAASTLIAVFQKTRQSVSHGDVAGLHQRLASEIRQFENRLKELRYKPEVILSARYSVCAVLDEAVLNTPWGAESGWSQRTLLSMFHNEAAGGEKFFQILDRMKEFPAENIDIIELQYIFISLGFEGKYRVVQRGRDAIELLRDELFACIRSIRGEYERSLSPNWRGLGNIRKSMTSYLPFWVVASLVGLVLVLSYSGLRYWLFETSSPVIAKLEQISENKSTRSDRLD